ncbi:hypothetical protein AGLY_016693 [Aphis glycines]|uniref:Uncharacterized protein n=1 Tax=Aphis glycines TaxID=307491 RepID=A0A6G0SX91_APHGL|nr:hypothetical protein AGLY_016693 [Aphis glycines]
MEHLITVNFSDSKEKESTRSTTAQQVERMDLSTQTTFRLTLVESTLELKTPSYKLLLIVKKELYAVKILFIELLGRQAEKAPYFKKPIEPSEEETNKTKEIGTQVELNKNIEIEKLVEISINTKEDSDSRQEIIKKNTKGKSLLDTTLMEDLNPGVEPRVLVLRCTPNLVHTELGPVRRKQRTKMSSVKATIEQVTDMIPICADAKDVCSFIRACNYECEAVDKETIPLLETIKKVLRGAFEQQLSPQTLQIRRPFDQPDNGRNGKIVTQRCFTIVSENTGDTVTCSSSMLYFF